MKLNKKKELYVNAIVGGKRPSEDKRERLAEGGLMEENIDYYDGNDYDWVKPALMKQTFKHLKELYTLLNG